ncbi:MAG: DUF3179 domain-containing protein [Planctomycetes bacterium]|nr:DUF3179 domain-containing protein [Planctomycetota bacterium]
MSRSTRMAAARLSFGLTVSPLMLGFMVTAASTLPSESVMAQETRPKPRKVVKAYVQMRPGGERQEAEMPVFESPVDLPIIAADEADLKDNDLVMGMVKDGEAMAWPIRYLAMFEVVNSNIGDTPVAPTW